MALIDYKKYSSEIKTISIVVAGACMWGDLKTDIAVHNESHRLIEFRLSQLENRVVINSSPKAYALLPKSTQIETEKKKYDKD